MGLIYLNNNYVILNGSMDQTKDTDLVAFLPPPPDTFKVLIVGGGGGGASSGSGGSGGGSQIYYLSGYTLTDGTYSLTIGSGGASGANGGTTSFLGFTATGGGYGGSNWNGANGANGGGAGFGAFGLTRTGGIGNGCCNQLTHIGWDGPGWGGLDGGCSFTIDTDPPVQYTYAGGGGGATGLGGSGVAGDGFSSSITGSALGYAGGGGPAVIMNSIWSVKNGTHGGGGANGDAVRGGGGSGGGGTEATGGNGIITIRYTHPLQSASGGDSIYQDGTDWVHIFNTTGTNDFIIY